MIPAELILTRSTPPAGATATWQSDPYGPVTALTRVPGDSALAGVGPRVVALDGGASSPDLGGRVSSIAASSSKIFAAVCPDTGAMASVHVRDGGLWSLSLGVPRRSSVVGLLAGKPFVVAGDRSGADAIVYALDVSGVWRDVAHLGLFEPSCVVEVGGELWIGGATAAGGARLLHGDGMTFQEQSLPVTLLSGESSSVVALGVAGNRVWASVVIRDDQTQDVRQGSLFGVTSGGQSVLVEQLANDAAFALAGWDGTLWVGTESGRVLWLDDTSDLVEETGFAGSGPIRSLAGGDSLLVGTDSELHEHEWTLASSAASSSSLQGAVYASTLSSQALTSQATTQVAAAAAMTFTSITPKLGPTTGGTAVKIVGTNFANITSVKIGGVALTTLVVTATQITGKTGAHAAGKVEIVIASSSNGTLTKASVFTYYVPMTLTSIAPTSGPVAGGTAVTIKGTNFLNVTSITVGGIELTSKVITATQITGKTGAHAAGLVDVIVKSSTNGAVTKKKGFTYGVAIKAIAPLTGSPAGGTAVTITGTNFLNVTSVKVGGLELTSKVIAATKITGKTVAHAAGRVDLVIVSSTQGTATKVGAFTYAAPSVSFATNVAPILNTKCTICHTQGGTSSFAPFTDVASGPAVYARVRNGVSTFNTPATYVVPSDATKSLIVLKTQVGGAMNDKLTAADALVIKNWVLGGANP